MVRQSLEEARIAVNKAARVLHINAQGNDAEQVALDLSGIGTRLAQIREKVVGSTGRETVESEPTAQPEPKRRRFRARS